MNRWANWLLRGFEFFSFAVIILAACWLRTFELSTIPWFNCDEAFYGLQSSRILNFESFDARTTSGNFLSPLFVLTQLPILASVGPTVLASRLPAVLGGLGSVVGLYFLVRAIGGQSLARLGAVILVALPPSVLFSRIGCEFSQTPLVGVIAAWFAWSGKGIRFWLWISFALVVHPTNIFLVPFLLPVYFTKQWVENPTQRRRLLISTFIGTFVVVGPFSILMFSNPNVAQRSEEPRDWLLFVDGFGRFLTLFPTLLKPDALARYVVVFRILATSLLVAGLVGLSAQRQWTRLAIVLGFLSCLSCFHLASGALVLDGEANRYGAVLIVPTVLSVTLLISGIVPIKPICWKQPSIRLASTVMTTGFGGILLLITFDHAIRPYIGNDWTRLCNFQTKAPHAEAASIIRGELSKADSSLRNLLVTQDLYLNGLQYEYLLADDPVEIVPYFTLFQVWQMRQTPDGTEVEDRRIRMLDAISQGAFAVTEPGSPADRGGGQIEEGMVERFGADRVQSWSNGSQAVFRLRPRVLASKTQLIEDVIR